MSRSIDEVLTDECEQRDYERQQRAASHPPARAVVNKAIPLPICLLIAAGVVLIAMGLGVEL